MANCVVDAGRPPTSRQCAGYMHRQHQDQKPSRSGRLIYEVRQDKETQPPEQKKHDRSFDSVKIKYFKFDNFKSIIFTELESTTSQKGVYITYKIDSGSDGNLMPFKIFRT